jgi:hypothetical protein
MLVSKSKQNTKSPMRMSRLELEEIKQLTYQEEKGHGMAYENITDFPSERIMQMLHFVAPKGFLEMDGEILITNRIQKGKRAGTFCASAGERNLPQVVAMVPHKMLRYPHRRKFNKRATVTLHYDTYDEQNKQWVDKIYSYYTCSLVKPLKRNGLIVSLVKGKNGKDRIKNGKGYLSMTFLSAEEELVHTLAHEFRHMWQWYYPKRKRVWGARGQYSERDADAYAHRKLREWRAIWGPKDIFEMGWTYDDIYLTMDKEDWSDWIYWESKRER